MNERYLLEQCPRCNTEGCLACDHVGYVSAGVTLGLFAALEADRQTAVEALRAIAAGRPRDGAAWRLVDVAKEAMDSIDAAEARRAGRPSKGGGS